MTKFPADVNTLLFTFTNALLPLVTLIDLQLSCFVLIFSIFDGMFQNNLEIIFAASYSAWNGIFISH